MLESLRASLALYRARMDSAARRIVQDAAIGRRPERHDVRLTERYMGLAEHTQRQIAVLEADAVTWSPAPGDGSVFI